MQSNSNAAVRRLETKNEGTSERGDLQRELKGVLDGLKARDEEIKSFAGKTTTELVEHGARLLEIEQKLARRGGAATSATAVCESPATDAPGTKTLSKADLASKSRIAERLGAHKSDFDANITLGGFLRAVAGVKTPEAVKALAEGTNTTGGYAVPTPLLPGILAALSPASSLLSAGASLVMVDGTAGKSFSVAGISTIPTAAWRSENGAVAESDPAFRAIEVTPRSLSFLFKVSRELMQDAPGLEQALNIAIGQAFAAEMDRAGLRGSGTAPEIRGLLNTVGVHAVGSGTNGARLTNYAPFIRAARLIADANAPAPGVAITSPREAETMALFADSTGQPLRRPDALSNWQFGTSSQIPVNLTVSTSTDCGEMYVGDFTQFAFYLREGVSIQIARELYAGTGQIGFICHARLDVAALYPAAFAVITGVRPPA